MEKVVWFMLAFSVKFILAEAHSFSSFYTTAISAAQRMHMAPHLFHIELSREVKHKVSVGSELYQLLIVNGDPVTRLYEYVLQRKNEDRAFALPFQVVNKTCEIDFLKIVASLAVDRPEWSLRFADAMFKIPAGLLDGNVNWFGAFDECTNIKVDTALYKTVGKYCMVPISGVLKVGACVPNSCMPEDIVSIVKDVNTYLHNNSFHNLTIMNITTSVDEIQCNNPNIEPAPYFYVAVTVASVLLAVNVISTLYDLVKRVRSAFFLQSTDVLEINTASSSVFATSGSLPLSQSVTDDAAPLVTDSLAPQQQYQIHTSALLPSFTSVQTPKLSRREEIFLSFSVIRNGAKILNVEQPTSRGAHTLQALHGIRLLSMWWLILSHTVLFAAASGVDNALSLLNMFQSLEFQVIAHSFYAVDTFLVLGGFLLGYLTLRQLDKLDLSPGHRPWKIAKFFGKLYLHRYIRLTPCYALCILVYMGIAPYFMTGPGWQQNPDPLCTDGQSWWKNLLYVHNLIDKDKECMGWTWYLSVDFQLFLISPIPLLAFYWRPFAGWFTTILIMLASSLSSGLTAAKYNFEGAPLSSLVNNRSSSFDIDAFKTHFFGDYFVMPWCRAAPWAVGLALGCSLHRLPPTFAHSRLQSSKVRFFVGLFGWAVALLTGLTLVYGMWPVYAGYYELPPWVSYFYWAGSRLAWGLAISWLIYACVSGIFPGNLIRKALSWGAFAPLSRLTYCAYLFHPIIMCIYFWSMRNPVHMYDMEITYLFLASVVFVFSSVFLVACCFEIPVATLERLLLDQHDHRE